MAGARDHEHEQDRRRQSREMLLLCRKVKADLASLIIDPSEMTTGPSSKGTILRNKYGSAVGTLNDHGLVRLLLDSPGVLRKLMAYVSQLESEAYQARDDRRRARVIVNALYAAERTGFGTHQGQAILIEALEADSNRD